MPGIASLSSFDPSSTCVAGKKGRHLTSTIPPAAAIVAVAPP